MERIYLPEALGKPESIDLPKDKARYLTQVHRLGAGDQLVVFDGEGREYEAELRVAGKAGARIALGECLREEPRPAPPIELAQALPKQGKMETVIQKAAELGVMRVQPFSSARAVVKLKRGQGEAKSERWNKVAEEACRQSRRCWLCGVEEPCEFEALFSDDARVLLAYEGADALPLGDALAGAAPERVRLIVGPEGGFAESEIAHARAAGATIVSLGPRVLRTETAGPVLAALVQYVWGDLGGWRTPHIYKG